VTIWPRKHKRKIPSQAFTRSKQIYRIGRSLKFCGTVHGRSTARPTNSTTPVYQLSNYVCVGIKGIRQWWTVERGGRGKGGEDTSLVTVTMENTEWLAMVKTCQRNTNESRENQYHLQRLSIQESQSQDYSLDWCTVHIRVNFGENWCML